MEEIFLFPIKLAAEQSCGLSSARSKLPAISWEQERVFFRYGVPT